MLLIRGRWGRPGDMMSVASCADIGVSAPVNSTPVCSHALTDRMQERQEFLVAALSATHRPAPAPHPPLPYLCMSMLCVPHSCWSRVCRALSCNRGHLTCRHSRNY